MCGIVGILGKSAVASDLVDALRRLEYRGYDSAGIATVEGGRLERRRAEGKLRNLEKRLIEEPLAGRTGIGHTRWATHGRPTERNAHPHMTNKVSVVHNGIIENFRELRTKLEAKGHRFDTDTDTEAVVHLITDELNKGNDPVAAVGRALDHLQGAFALGIIFAGEDDLMIAARKGSPLAIGHGTGEMYLGSDAIALAPFTDAITYLEEGDWAVLRRSGAEIYDRQGTRTERPVIKAVASSLLVDKGNYRHFMAKEINEQPEVVSHTLANYLDMATAQVRFPDLGLDLAQISRVTISACGTAYYAGLVAKYWIERYARVPVDIDVASEMRYREAPLPENGLAVFVSQSGETADTLATLRYCKANKQRIASIVNVRTSTIARESDAALPTLAGPEIGVASTKAFTCQLSVLACLAIAIAKARGAITKEQEIALVTALTEVPRHIAAILRQDEIYLSVAQELAKARDVLYLGRGSSFPIALEGALKLKEISYIHAEGYAAGELKHGPIALIDENVPVIVVAPEDDLFEKTVSNLQEVAARGGQIILISDAAPEKAGCTPAAHIQMPKIDSFIAPLLYAVPIQLIAYHTAVQIGTDVDQPRNLAKSVTVE
ncbi:glucosamine/fructose-6-phosphate aminotransferase, isomerizing [Hyphomicrobium denitrificans ATCC 51888]|uniref:Glutamine--fructose-6-phosphate aminotransferase [isomerizing] n=1 Tax=Hyphomicrobium denitrificans (strain ATCC 51888 / DSM 1869 / NCIMB 11706 / TK 0415) TaxID=582899 RepID=D8JYK4_HYPDA|nr:glutamine--fructose-6-phosphate transaminase (isomerizing) [Hyphomicrobium denitrificans]ADJ23456.1 glucosamine/fructose-6-phosphate aminotransferase, isomerizing [Hyphomicrobium denitrificans ATCC 51888]